MNSIIVLKATASFAGTDTFDTAFHYRWSIPDKVRIVVTDKTATNMDLNCQEVNFNGLIGTGFDNYHTWLLLVE